MPGYEILEVLGCGGMGIVYKARQVGLKRLVALKMVRGAGFAGTDQLKRFRTEAEAAARLQHPHIVQVYDIGDATGCPFVSLEYVDGGSLASQLHGEPQSPRLAAELLLTLARAMAYAHSQGVVHRDLKPANVLLAKARGSKPPGDETSQLSSTAPDRRTTAPVAKIADFGLAKQLDDDSGQTRSGTVLGTPSYMAPEQALGQTRDVGPAADVYALGAILYELLTGRPPFRGATVLETLEQVRAQEPVPPTRLQPRVPRDLETICLKCLHKSPGSRYAGAAPLADDLERYLAGRPITARPVGKAAQVWRWCRRNPRVALLSSAVVASLLVGAVVAGVFAFRADEAARRAIHEAGLKDKEAERAREGEENANKARREAERSNYLSDVALAHQLWRGNDVAAAMRVLAGCPPEYRNWEWDYLYRLCQSAVVHTDAGSVAALSFSSDGLRYCVGESDGRISVRDAANGRVVWERRCKPGTNRGQLVFADGGREVVWLEGKTIRFAEISTGSERSVSQPTKTRTEGLSVRRDGKVRAIGFEAIPGKNHKAVIWDPETGRVDATFACLTEVRERHLLPTAVALSPDARHLAVLSGDSNVRVGDPRPEWEKVPALEGQFKLFDVALGKAIGDFPALPAAEATVSFSPDSRRVAWADGGRVMIWGLNPSAPPRAMGAHGKAVRGLAFSPDGARLASAGADGAIKIWELAGEEELFTLRGHGGAASRVAFSPDGARLLSGGGDSVGPRQPILLWDTRHDPSAQSTLAPDALASMVLALNRDATRHLLLSLKTVRDEWTRTFTIHDTATGRQVCALEGPEETLTPSAAFSPNGRELAVVAREAVVVFDAGTGRRGATLATGPLAATQHRAVVYSPDGRLLAVGATAEDRDFLEVIVWERESGAVRRRLAVPPGEKATESKPAKAIPEALALTFSPDGTRVAASIASRASGTDRWAKSEKLVVWDLADGRVVADRPCDLPLFALAFDPGGRRLAGVGGRAAEGALKVWESDAWKEVVSLSGHTKLLLGVAFSPDGSRLVTAGVDRNVKLWEAATGREILTLMGHRRTPTVVQFSTDGSRLFSAVGVEREGSNSPGPELRLPAEIRIWGGASD